MTDRIAPDRLAMMVEASDLDDLPWSDGSTPTRNGATGRKPGNTPTPEASRRSRLNASRGKRIQRERIEALGGRNLAGNNPNLDGIGTMFAYESKSGKSFPERPWRWLKGIPIRAGQTQVLIITEAPGPGHRARSVVVVDFDDWRDLHGEPKP